MKKTILALAVLGATASLAHAQSNVTLYGVVDTGFVKESSTSARMGSNETSRIGFRGQEDLGGGLKATFELEQRLNLNDGTNTNSYDLGQNFNSNDWFHGRDNVQFQGAANVGLAGGFGAVRFGRVNELSTETYRRIDPFNQNGVGSSIYSFWLRSETLSNTVRYDSPSFNGFSAGLSYTLKADDNDANTPLAPVNLLPDGLNNGYAISLKYDNGPIYAVGNYSRPADTDKSDLWNIGGAYSFGNVRVSLGYQRSSMGDFFSNNVISKQEDWTVGLEWKVGPGALNASYNHTKVDDNFFPDFDGKVKKYALGYTYDLSKRTALYGVIAHTSSDTKYLGQVFNSNNAIDDSVTAYQIGLNHRF